MKTKSRKILGIPLALFLVGILFIGGASAALVAHFATLTTNVSVEAPITLEQELYTLDGEVLNDGNNHYLLIKGKNKLEVDVPAIPVITIMRYGQPIIDTIGIHLALDIGGDMHYCYDPAGDMTNVYDCDIDYVQYLTNNPDWFDWAGTDATYELSGFVSPVINHGGDSWVGISSLFENGVLTLPTEGFEPGLFAALLVVRADLGVTPGTYTIEVELKPVPA